MYDVIIHLTLRFTFLLKLRRVVQIPLSPFRLKYLKVLVSMIIVFLIVNSTPFL